MIRRRRRAWVCSSALVLACCRWDPAPPGVAVEAVLPPSAWFVDATSETGLDFVHVNGMTGEFYYPEVIGPGVALLDYDNDGDLDVFLVQGGSLDGTLDGALDGTATDGSSAGSRLYRNDLQRGPGGAQTVRFVDVTAASRIQTRDYGMGAAVGDYNNDGCVDLYVTALGRNQLFRNRCDGTFVDASNAGVHDAGWSVSAAFADVDRDGWLDLYVGHYLNWDRSLNTPCFGNAGARAYCAPRVYVPQQSRLYHNERNGTFRDVTSAAGLAVRFGPALGVVATDVDADGWTDFYIANDGQENQLWINQRNGTLVDRGMLAGAAWSDPGRPKAGMGVDAGDIDNDGDDDIVVANLTGEGHDLYVNDGAGHFESGAASSGLKVPSLPFTGFGAGWLDVDNDGLLDLLTVNGTVQRIDALVRAGDRLPLRQRKQLFHNVGHGRFEDLSRGAGAVFGDMHVGRGAAFGDLDNDGDTDVIVGNNGGAAQVLRNDVGHRQHWIGLRLARPSLNAGGDRSARVRDAEGARVEVVRAAHPTLSRYARTSGSFASARDPRVLIGLGASSDDVVVRVAWPGGRVEQWPDLQIDAYTTLVEGEGVRP